MLTGARPTGTGPSVGGGGVGGGETAVRSLSFARSGYHFSVRLYRPVE